MVIETIRIAYKNGTEEFRDMSHDELYEFLVSLSRDEKRRFMMGDIVAIPALGITKCIIARALTSAM